MAVQRPGARGSVGGSGAAELGGVTIANVELPDPPLDPNALAKPRILRVEQAARANGRTVTYDHACRANWVLSHLPDSPQDLHEGQCRLKASAQLFLQHTGVHEHGVAHAVITPRS